MEHKRTESMELIQDGREDMGVKRHRIMMEDRNRGLKKILRQKSGVTLVELVVTFALLAIFMTAACQVMADAIKVYHKIRAVGEARQVADTLMDKVCAMIEGAKDTSPVEISGDGSRISFTEKTGSAVCITTTDHWKEIGDTDPESSNSRNPGKYDGKDNLAVIYYYAVFDPGASDGVRKNKYQAVDWMFDKGVYMEYTVKSFTFQWAKSGGEYPANVIKAVLTLESPRYGEYTASRYIQCYNLPQ